MYSTGGQELYLRLAAADRYLLLVIANVLFACFDILSLRNCDSFSLNCDYGEQFYSIDNGNDSIVADQSFLNS